MQIEFVGIQELDRLIQGLSSQEQEELAARIFAKLSPEERSRVMGLSDSNLTVVTGSFVSLNADIAVNIQNSNELDPESLVKALLEYRRTRQPQSKK